MSTGTTRPTSRDVIARAGDLAAIAQTVYDAWDQDPNGEDPTLGTGGICDLIASAMSARLQEIWPGLVNISTETAACGENHIFVVAALADGVFVIDIPPGVYETGSGYVWRKKPGVSIDATDVALECLSRDPGAYWQYAENAPDPEPAPAAPAC